MSAAGRPYLAGLTFAGVLQWRRLLPLLGADTDRVDLESRLIKLLLEDRGVYPCRQRRLGAKRTHTSAVKDRCRFLHCSDTRGMQLCLVQSLRDVRDQIGRVFNANRQPDR